jgi:hypothetical protein
MSDNTYDNFWENIVNNLISIVFSRRSIFMVLKNEIVPALVRFYLYFKSSLYGLKKLAHIQNVYIQNVPVTDSIRNETSLAQNVSEGKIFI